MHFGVRFQSGTRQKVEGLQKITPTFNQGGT